MDVVMQNELQEAISAGEKALNSIYSTEKLLQSATNWGVVDMFGGGMLTDIIKHSKIKKAQNFLEQVKVDLSNFQRELGDIQIELNLKIELGDFLSLADFVFDNFFVDYAVQTKIKDALAQIQNLKYTIEDILNQLKQQSADN